MTEPSGSRTSTASQDQQPARDGSTMITAADHTAGDFPAPSDTETASATSTPPEPNQTRDGAQHHPTVDAASVSLSQPASDGSGVSREPQPTTGDGAVTPEPQSTPGGTKSPAEHAGGSATTVGQSAVSLVSAGALDSVADSRSHSSGSELVPEAASDVSCVALGLDTSRGAVSADDDDDSGPHRDHRLHELLQNLDTDTVDPRDGFKVLDDLFTGGKINEVQYKDLQRKQKYLQSMFWACLQNRAGLREDITETSVFLQQLKEKARQEEANGEKNEVVKEVAELHTIADLEGTNVDDLKRFLASFDQQRRTLENSTYQIKFKIRHMKEEKDQLQGNIDSGNVSSSKIYLNSPIMLEKEIRELNVEIRFRKQEIRNLNDDISTRDRLIRQRQDKTKKLQEKIALTQDDKVELLPRSVLVTRDADREEKHYAKLRKQIDVLGAEIAVVIGTLKDLNEATQKLDNERNELIKAMDKEYRLVDAKSKECASLSRDADRCRERSALLMDEKNRAENRLAMLGSEIRQGILLVRDMHKAVDRVNRGLRNAEENLCSQRDLMIASRSEMENLAKQVQQQSRAAAELPTERKALQQDVDTAHNDATSLTTLTIIERQDLQRLAKERAFLVRTQEQLTKQLDTLGRQHGNLIRMRDTNGRVFRKLRGEVELNEDELKNRITVVDKFKKKCDETEKQSRKLGERYEMAKKERDEMSAQLTISLTNCDELLKKTEILRSQQDTMLSRKLELERQHTLTRTIALKTILDKTLIQSTVNQEKDGMRELEKHRDQLDMIISSHQISLNAIKETIMSDLGEYKRQVVDRNERGLLLVERDEEACAFHEKIGLQQTFIERGYARIDACENDIVELNKVISTERHHLKCLRAQQDEIRRMEDTLADTRCELRGLNVSTLAATSEMETPNARRCRHLAGHVEIESDVELHVGRIEMQLYEAELRLLERQMVEAQVGWLVSRAQAQIDSNRVDSERLAKQANVRKRRVAATGRKFMANAAEVCVAKTEVRRLCELRLRLTQQLEVAQQRVAAGLPPTPNDRTLTAAPTSLPVTPRAGPSPRPTQYLPSAETSLPLPRPYGAFGPFKPQTPSVRLQRQTDRGSSTVGERQ